MTYLIDGYNLMHAIGLLRAGSLPRALRGARTRFLDWLADQAHGRGLQVRVVFDAQDAPAASDESDHRGVRVRFAFQRTADDEIEDLLAREPHPEQLTVVSNDARIREAARRRAAAADSCEQFVDRLIATDPTKRAANPEVDEKPGPGASAEELSDWLEAFSAPRRKPRGR